MKNTKRSEQGQAIILLAIGIITLLGFTALAIDGGRTYSEKRTIQGVSDTSSMTGALYLGKLGLAVDEAAKAEAVAAALARADSNGYDTEHVAVDVYEDPQYYYVETFITSTIQPVFAQLVFGGDLTVNATSVARVLKIKNFAQGRAMYANNPSDCRAFDQIGNGALTIINNGIFSNSNCNVSPHSVKIGGSASFTGDVITAAGSIDLSGDVTLYNPPEANADQQFLPILPTPDCSNLTNKNDTGTNLTSGIYNGIKVTNKDLILDPGLYCLTDDLELLANGTITGEGVTFFMLGQSTVKLNGGNSYLSAPKNDQWQDASGMYWNGMLIYMDYGNTSGLSMQGNEDSHWVGTIFAPDGDCTFQGTASATSQDIQIICDTIQVAGDSELLIEFNQQNQYIPPFIIDLVQ